MRTGRTAWVVALTSVTRKDLSDRSCASLLVALSGTLHLLSDFDLFTTLTILDAGGLIGSFHSVLVARSPAQASDPNYLPSAYTALAIPRHARCVYIDSDAGAIVAAKLLGWDGCLVARTGILRYGRRPGGAARRGRRVGHGAWYDHRFPNLRRALAYYIFGARA